MLTFRAYSDMIGAMAGQAAAMHVARIRSGYTDRAGRRREYESRLLRRTYRDGGKVRHETLANLSGLPEQVVDSIEAALQGAALVPAGQAMTIIRSVPHGHVAAVHAMAAKLGLPALLGPACPQRDLALALIVSRVARPGSKLSTLTCWPAGTWPRRRTRSGWPCSTCPARGWKARTARWASAGTPATARKARCRSNTGCSPTRRAGPSRSGCSRATPPTRPRSPRSPAWCGTSSGSPGWSWSATGG